MLKSSGYSTYNPARQSVIVSGAITSPDGTPPIRLGSSDRPLLISNNNQVDIEQPRPPTRNAALNDSNLPTLPSKAGQDRALPPFTARSTIIDRPHIINRSVDLAPLGNHTQCSRRSASEDDQQLAMPDAPLDEPRVWESPGVKTVQRLFPPRTYPSIVKSDRVASIRAIFTDAPSNCSLEIDFYPTITLHIAMEVFKVPIEIENERLLVRSESGGSMLFERSILRGADRQASEKLLGKVFTTVSEGIRYEQEMERGEPLIHLITLEIQGNVGKPCCLKVQSDEKTISAMAAQLWPAFPRMVF